MINKAKKLARQHQTDLFLYGIIGLSAFIVDFTTLQLTDKFSHNLLLATTSGILAGFIVSYGLNHLRFKRRHQDARNMKQALPLFVILFVFNTAFTFLCLDYNERHHITSRLLVKMITVGFIMLWNYVLFHTVIFRNGTKKES